MPKKFVSMSSTAILLALAMLLALPTGGCSDNAKAVSVNVTQENICEEIAEVMCHNMFQCCTGLRIEEVLGIEISTTEKECRSDMRLLCEDRSVEMQYAFENGTASFDQATAQACLEVLLAPKDICVELQLDPAWTELCAEIWVIGNQGVGDACFWDFECAENQYCAPNQECRMLPGAGDECDFQAPGNPCAEGLYCDGDDICVALGGKSDDCSPTEPCLEDLYCDWDAGEGTCRAKEDAGEECTNNWMCASNDCAPGICGGDGSFCEDDSDCQGQCDGTNDDCDDETDCEGVCDVSGDQCDDDGDCDVEPDDFCVHDQCLGNICEERYCVDTPDEVDYCLLGLGILGML